MLKKIIWLFIASLLIHSLSGCNPYSKDEFKEVIQNGFDRYRIENKLKGNFCFYLSAIKFPHTLEAINENDIPGKKATKRRRKLTLDLFTDIGLLTRIPIDGQPEIYHYDLTPLGKEYQHFYVKYYGYDGEPRYSNSFCYGVIKIDKITNIEVENDSKMPYPHKHEVYVDYDYHVENVPEWAVLNQDKLNHRYDWEVDLEGKTYKDQMRYQGEKDGYLHLFSGGYYRSMTPLLLEDEK